jgi:hypothetical protein
MPKQNACATQPDDDWLKLAIAAVEARDLVGRAAPTYRTLYARVLDGAIEARRVRGRIEISRPSLQRFLKSF